MVGIDICTLMNTLSLDRLQIIAFTHKTIPLELVGKFHIEEEFQQNRFTQLKLMLNLSELMYLSTCNRVEFVMVGDQVSPDAIIEALNISLSEADAETVIKGAEGFVAEEAVKHLFKVSSSLDSMVIGEREIITQVRNAYERSAKMSLSGDLIRLVIRKTIETAKQVFTETSIFRKPVSVVSLAFHRLRELDAPVSSRIVMIGAGKTNKAMARFLSKHGFRNITIYNRTPEKARILASEIGAQWRPLSEIVAHSGGFDILISCTGSGSVIVDSALFESLNQGEMGRKIIIDLAIPGDVDKAAFARAPFAVRHIDIEELKNTADKNLAERARDLNLCEEIVDKQLLAFHDIFKARQVELAMRTIPEKVKEIRETAINTVYAKEVESLDPESREILDKVVAYLEKKYISVPMKMAREVMLNISK
jgi:glutamyl-tRNA reductase